MKKRSIVLLGILAVLLNSCVYSLFPIYTDDTLVFKKELLGQWTLNDGEVRLLFEKMGSDNAKTSEKKDYKYTIEIKDGFTMSSDEPIFILQNGKKIYDEDSIKLIMRERMAVNDYKPAPPPSSETDAKQLIRDQIDEDKLTSKDVSYQGTVAVYEEKSYKLTVESGEGKVEAYAAHLVLIGDDLFLDLYPIKEYNSENISDNYFPVHTFYKVQVTEDKFMMTHFDLDKLNKLFESNLIRLRHENVDGTILITAQPKELQKFLDKYSDDESVFESTETYRKAS